MHLRTLEESDLETAPDREFALDVLCGLSETIKRLPSRYFYDETGSRLFKRIMELPEYYLSRCGAEILETNKHVICEYLDDDPFNVIELGAGDGTKTIILLREFMRRGLDYEYFPIDISPSAMEELIDRMNAQLPAIKGCGIISEYFEGIRLMSRMNSRRNFVLFLGSNIGNFNYDQAKLFLRNLWQSLNHNDYVLIAFDLKKDIDLLLKAYNDAQGVTREFNLNLLARINRELGGNFNVSKFKHYGTYNVLSGAMESFLVSTEKQSVFIRKLSKSFSFDAWEPIHTEYSYKYSEDDIRQLAESTGFAICGQLFDSKRYFAQSIWKVDKSTSEDSETLRKLFSDHPKKPALV